MRCSVVFGVTLRLLVINISSSSPAINTADYYQRCVITCDTLAVLHWRPRWQHLPVAALTQAVKPDIGSESRFLPTPPTFDAPVRGRSTRNIAMPFGTEKLEWCGYHYDGEKKFEDIFIRFDMIHERDRRIDRQTDGRTDTAWRHRPRLCIPSLGKNARSEIKTTQFLCCFSVTYCFRYRYSWLVDV